MHEQASGTSCIDFDNLILGVVMHRIQTAILIRAEDEVIEIDAAGTGCLLVHRSVIEKFRAESDPVHQQGKWGFFQDMPLHGQWVGEDLLFSLRAKGFGFKIFAHTGVQLAHERRYWLSKDHHTDFRRFNLPRHHSPEKEVGHGSIE